MEMITKVGLDLTKFVFQVHGIASDGSDCASRAPPVSGAGLLSQIAVLPDRRRGLRQRALLCAGDSSFGTHRSDGAIRLSEGYAERHKQLMSLISSANNAIGFHARDPNLMDLSIRRALGNNVAPEAPIPASGICQVRLPQG